MAYIVGAIIGYIFGCINTAYIVAKIKGVNIKKVGTNNAGASNVFISVGKTYGVLAGAGDVLKSYIASLAVYLIFDNFDAAIIAGIMAVIGHIYPFWMHFNGGKGLASLMGVMLFYNFKFFAVLVLIIIAITLITDYIALGTLSVSALIPFWFAFFDKNYILLPIFVILAIIIWYKHKENMKRIIDGTEIGFLRKKKNKK